MKGMVTSKNIVISPFMYVRSWMAKLPYEYLYVMKTSAIRKSRGIKIKPIFIWPKYFPESMLRMIYVILGKLKKCRICWLKEQSLFVSGVFFLSRSKVFLPKIQESENFSATFISVWEIGPIPNRTYALCKLPLMVLPNQTTTNFRYKNQFLKPLNRQSFRYW